MKLIDAQLLLEMRADALWTERAVVKVAAALQVPAARAGLLGLRLSPHFTLRELTASATADARGLVNMPDAVQLLKLRALCVHILEPLRAQFGAVRITSGLRLFTPDSQHGKGEAADFEVPGVANVLVARWIRDYLDFDQLILEAWNPRDPNAGWIHCSWRASGRRGRSGRNGVLRTPTGGPPYTAGLPN
ncbi:D-Ala-D-Ala carboxypeptidase family metallohydrolase [Sphingomonadaceae bacterium G21617-S1]|nr:D-Ala-D-Ala carboxypeptidase family metallohydrolase [Sphingomonadaceae bacterium G21617-S1]